MGQPMGSSVDGDITEGELDQAHLRYRAGAPVWLLYLVAHLVGFADLREALWAVGAYVLFGIAWTLVVIADVGTERVRRYVVIVADEALVALCLYVDPPHLAPLVFMPIFMTLGNGLRFGFGLAVYSAVMAALFIGAVFVSSPFWSEIPTVSFGIVAGTLVVPVYGVRLNNRLQHRRRALEAKARALEVQARIDPLTGLANRAGLHRALREASHGWAVLYVDLDGFKQVNDTVGHDAGDQVLRDVAAALRGSVRGGDTVARLGGDEFAILATGVRAAADVSTIASNVLEGARRVRVTGHPELRIGASVGGCLVLAGDPRGSDDVIRCADEAMLAAKRAGKGRFVLDGATALIREPTPVAGWS